MEPQTNFAAVKAPPREKPRRRREICGGTGGKPPLRGQSYSPQKARFRVNPRGGSVALEHAAQAAGVALGAEQPQEAGADDQVGLALARSAGQLDPVAAAQVGAGALRRGIARGALDGEPAVGQDMPDLPG